MARKNGRKHKNQHHIHKQLKTETPVPVPTLLKKEPKQVHFPEEDDLVKVVEFDDDTESRQMRECYWEVFARDRARFKDRIQQSEDVLNAILDPRHRERILQGSSWQAMAEVSA